jgi:hypothetical protein
MVQYLDPHECSGIVGDQVLGVNHRLCLCRFEESWGIWFWASLEFVVVLVWWRARRARLQIVFRFRCCLSPSYRTLCTMCLIRSPLRLQALCQLPLRHSTLNRRTSLPRRPVSTTVLRFVQTSLPAYDPGRWRVASAHQTPPQVCRLTDLSVVAACVQTAW